MNTHYCISYINIVNGNIFVIINDRKLVKTNIPYLHTFLHNFVIKQYNKNPFV